MSVSITASSGQSRSALAISDPSSKKLAAASGVTLGTVRVYGLGQRTPSHANVLALANITTAAMDCPFTRVV